MTRTVNTLRRQARGRCLLVLLTATGASLLFLLAGLVGTPPNADAATSNCTQRCVIMVEVNGLEPKDITKANTPFLWALAHSGDNNNDPQASSFPALIGRNGWAWQAARTAMSTGDGPATQALLTGDTAEQSSDPADLFATPSTGPDGKTNLTYYKTGGSTGISDPACGGPTNPCDPASNNLGTTILSQAQQNNKNIGMWLGDPALCTLVNNNISASDQPLYDEVPGTPNTPLENIAKDPTCPDLWAPGSPSAPSSSGSPSDLGQTPFCPPPTSWPTVNGTPYYPATCQVSDSQVLGQAGTDLGQASNGYPDLSFIYLADVGRAKQAAGDSDCFRDPSLAQASCGAPSTTTEPPSVSRALHTTDAQLAAFASALSLAENSTPTVAWNKTYLMVVGSHGYETTPAPLRIPDPDAMPGGASQATPPCSADQGGAQAGVGDLSCYVAEASSSNAVLVPQGTMGTVYYKGQNDPQSEESTLNTVVDRLCQPQSGSATCSPNSKVNQACQQLYGSVSLPPGTQAVPNCIEKVYYVDPSVIPASDASRYQPGQFLFGMPGDPGYRTASNPSYDPNPDCQSSDSGSAFYDASGCDGSLPGFYKNQLASWHLNALTPSAVATDPSNPQNTTDVFKPSGASGQLVVVFGPGWSAGPLVGANNVNTNGVQTPVPGVVAGNAGDPINPYTGSGGGPRDRAIAAIVNGPDSGSNPVVQYPDSAPGSPGDGLAPVTNDNGANPSASQPYVCSTGFMSANPQYQDNVSSASFAVDQANADPSNDGAALGSPVFNSQFDSYVPRGHECQADIIDFAPTIEGLLAIPTASSSTDQADVRFLDEAFAKCLGQNTTQPSGTVCGNVQTVGKAAPPPPPPPPVPTVTPPRKIIIIAPKPPKKYKFHGLIRHVQAQLVDQSNHTVPFARPGAYLSSIRITADFGKPHSEVTITLYKRSGGAGDRSAHSSRTNLKAIVRFCPFTVTRAPNVQLRFEVPTAYQPDHVGLAVRQVRMLHSATGPGCGKAKHSAFVPYGRTAGAVVPILDAGLLHKRKPCPTSLSFTVPHGPGVKVESAEVLKGSRVIRVIPRSRLHTGTLVLPAKRLPGGTLSLRVRWVTAGKQGAAVQTALSSLYNCAAAQRRKLGTG